MNGRLATLLTAIRPLVLPPTIFNRTRILDLGSSGSRTGFRLEVSGQISYSVYACQDRPTAIGTLDAVVSANLGVDRQWGRQDGSRRAIRVRRRLNLQGWTAGTFERLPDITLVSL